MGRFQDRCILVTGAASGIGLATARRLADEGARRLVLTDINAAALDAVELPGEVDRLAGDVSDEAFWDNAASALGDIDHAVVNAGVAGAAALKDHDYAEWRRILAVNLDGAFLTLRAAMRALDGRGGSIVAVASAAGVKAEAGVGAYGASKAALIHLVKVAAKEGAATGVRVNAIAPGGVETPVWDAVPMFANRVTEIGREAAFAELASHATPLGRYAKPEEIAGQIAYLLSDETRFVTGAILISDGGYTI